MNVNWFPGHMAKTRELIKDNIKLVDVVIELLDARIPLSSKNPEFDSILGTKPKIVALNKFDLSDAQVNKEWKKWYDLKGHTCIFVNSISGTGMKDLKTQLKNVMKDRLVRDAGRGRVGRTIKTMVVGIPNVGKSTFINKLAGKSVAKTGDRPGVTRNKQWVRLGGMIELLDMPGILWPKFDDKSVGLNLAFTGAIKDEILDTVELSIELLGILRKSYPKQLSDRYKIDINQEITNLALLEQIAVKRGCILSGGKIDLNRMALIFLKEFRDGTIGHISLERPDGL